MNLPIAILALQGAFAEHRKILESLGSETFEIRQAADLEHPCGGLILPGGESTVQGKLLRELELFDILRQRIASGLPVFATCAGAILLAEKLADDTAVHFGTLPVTIRRNAYGRQTASFYISGKFTGVEGAVDMPFIRAPQIVSCAENVEILASYCGQPTAVRYRNQLAMTFHPEITGSGMIHEYFLKKVIDVQ